MAIVRRSIEFNSCDSVVGANEYSPGGGNTISIINDEGKEIQGTACVVEQIGGGTLTQAIGEVNGNTRTGRFGAWLGSGTWNAVTTLQYLLYNGVDELAYTVPSSYYPATFGFIPVWQAGAGIQAVGMKMTTSSIPNSAGNNYFYDNITYIPSNDWPYAINGTSSISALAVAELVKNTGFNQTCIKSNGVYNFFAGIVIGWDGSTTPVLTDFTFSESGETFVIVNIPTMTVVGGVNHSRWTVRMDATNPSFSMTNCTYQASEPVAANRVHDVELIFIGTNGSASITDCNIFDLDQLTLTSVCTVSGGTLRAVSITQGGANIKDGTVIATQSTANNSTVSDASFSALGITDVTFRQRGTGHAITITGDVSLTGVRFTGYGATGSSDAAILVNTTSPVTISTDGTAPSYRTIGTGNVTVVGPDRNFELTGLKDRTEVRLINPATNTEIAGVENVIGGVGSGINNGGGTVTVSGTTDNNTFNYAYQFSASTNILAAILSSSTYQVVYLEQSLLDSDKSIPIQQRIDRNSNL